MLITFLNTKLFSDFCDFGEFKDQIFIKKNVEFIIIYLHYKCL